jgi:hypothetical protein
MSKAVWRPAPGRKLGFLVVQDEALLGLIFLASPVIRLEARDAYLFPEKFRNEQVAVSGKYVKNGKFSYGLATRDYMDMSVCVATQPVAWHWNLGKLMALLAPTFGDFVNSRYHEKGDVFKGVTTTSLWGRSTQYNRIYKYLGLTKGHGHEHIKDPEFKMMVEYLREHCVHCNPKREEEHDREWWLNWAIPLKVRRRRLETIITLPAEDWCAVPGMLFGDGANARMRRIAAYKEATENDIDDAEVTAYLRACAAPGTDFGSGPNARMRRVAAFKKAGGVRSDGAKVTLEHGKLRGVYYHPAVPSEQRQDVIQKWYERWGLPRYERLKNEQPPYNTGLEGKPA